MEVVLLMIAVQVPTESRKSSPSLKEAPAEASQGHGEARSLHQLKPHPVTSVVTVVAALQSFDSRHDPPV